MGILDYYFRTAKFDFIRNNDSHTIVVFVHGVLSNSYKAFKLYAHEGYFWDLLKNEPVFCQFDFGLFSYGKIDVSYLLERAYPINNLVKIAFELNGYISDYKNVLFVAHSQGGLLAKAYASLFYEQQGIHFITLHTPHRNKSFSVMRFNGDEIWDKHACYQVPHIFCGSINDRKIVKPDNAFTTLKDRRYLSKDQTKNHLGHSHLSTSPDEKLLGIYFRDIFHFMNSGLSQVFCSTAKPIMGNNDSSSTIEIVYSRTPLKFVKINGNYKTTIIITNPWYELIDQSLAIIQNVNSKSSGINGIIQIKFIGCSVNYFTKYLSNYFLEHARLKLKDLDFHGSESRSSTNNHLCEWTFENSYSEQNPYKHLPFDSLDFKKGSLIEDKEFLDMFLVILSENKFTISRYYKAGTYKENLKKYYKITTEKYRRDVSSDIYSDCFTDPSIGIENFERILNDIVVSINNFPEKKNYYNKIYEIIKMRFSITRQYVGIRQIEVIISKLMKSDGEVYWMDKYLMQIFDKNKLEKTIT